MVRESSRRTSRTCVSCFTSKVKCSFNGGNRASGRAGVDREMVERNELRFEAISLVLEELVENQRRLVEETTGLIHSLHEGMASTNCAIRFLLKRETERNEVAGPSSAEGESSKMSDKAKGKRREK